MYRILYLLFFLSFAPVVLNCSIVYAQPPELISPLPCRLRAGYLNGVNINLVEEMSQNGMNAAVVNFQNLTPPIDASYAGIIQNWADKCALMNLAFLPVINWWGSNEPSWFMSYNHVISADGELLAKTPCPYTQDFWDRCIKPRFVEILRAVGTRLIQGVLIDMEMYGADVSYYRGDCYCDTCYARYMQAKGQTGALPVRVDRARLVQAANDLEFYRGIEREAARSFATELRNYISNIRPGLRIGVLDLEKSIPIFEGQAIGFGTPTTPALCFTEKTFEGEMASYAAQAKQLLTDLGAYVDVVSGVWQSVIPLVNFPSELYQNAHDSYGYWIFTMQTFEKPSYMPFQATIPEQWSAIQQVNNDLDNLAIDANYQSSLIPQDFVPLLDPTYWTSRFVTYNYFPLIPQNDNIGTMPIATLRGTNWIYFYAKKNDTINFELTKKQIGEYTNYVRAGIVSPSRVRLSEGFVTDSEPLVFNEIASENGIYGLLVVSGNNAVDITKASHPYAVYIDPKVSASYNKVIPPLFIALKPDATAIELELETESSSERVKGTVIAEDDTVLWVGEVEGVVKVRIAPASPSTYIQLKFEKLPDHILDDVKVRGVEGVLPFAATDVFGLLGVNSSPKIFNISGAAEQ